MKIEIPIVSNSSYRVRELIPIPFNQNNKTKIVNMNAKYLVDMNGTKIISYATIKKCARFEKAFFCNSIITEELQTIDNCTLSLVKNKNDELKFCELKTIENHNYFIHTDEHTIYAFITKPIDIEISCDSKQHVYQLNQSMEIAFPQCEIYKLMNEYHYTNDTTTIHKMESSFPLTKPNMNITDVNKTYIFLEFSLIDKHKIKLIKLYDKTIEIKQKVEEIKTDRTESFLIFIQSAMSPKNSISPKIFYIIIPIIVLIMINFLCRKTKKSPNNLIHSVSDARNDRCPLSNNSHESDDINQRGRFTMDINTENL